MIPLLHFGTSQKFASKKQQTQSPSTGHPVRGLGASNMQQDSVIQDFLRGQNQPTGLEEDLYTRSPAAQKAQQAGQKLMHEFALAQIRINNGQPAETEALINAVQDMLDAGAHVNNSKIGLEAKTLLQMAVENGCPKTVQLLLKNGADAYIEDKTGKTSWNLLEEQEALLHQTEDPQNNPHRLPLQATREALEKNDKVLKKLHEALTISQSKVSAGEPGESEESVNTVRELVEQNHLNVNASLPPSVSQTGGSLLHLAIGAAWPKSVSYLLKQGADTTKQDELGHTPLALLEKIKKEHPQSPALETMTTTLKLYSLLPKYKPYASAIKELNKHLPAKSDAVTEEPEDAKEWIGALIDEAGYDILHQTDIPGLNRSGSLFEIVALAGWPNATRFVLRDNHVNPTLKTSSGKTVAGLLDKQMQQHKDNKALKETQKNVSKAVVKATALSKAKAQMSDSLQRIENGEPSETDDLVNAVQGYIKLLKNDSFIDQKRTFLHIAAQYGWPKTTEMLLKHELDPRTVDREDAEQTSFQIIEDSIAAAKKLPKSPGKTRRLQELDDTRKVIFRDKKTWDALTDVENALDGLEERRNKNQYGDTSESEKAIQNFITSGGNVNQFNHFFPIKGALIHAMALYCLQKSIPAVMAAGGDLNRLDDLNETPLKINEGVQLSLKEEIRKEQNTTKRINLRRELKKAEATEALFKEEQAKQPKAIMSEAPKTKKKSSAKKKKSSASTEIPSSASKAKEDAKSSQGNLTTTPSPPQPTTDQSPSDSKKGQPAATEKSTKKTEKETKPKKQPAIPKTVDPSSKTTDKKREDNRPKPEAVAPAYNPTTAAAQSQQAITDNIKKETERRERRERQFALDEAAKLSKFTERQAKLAPQSAKAPKNIKQEAEISAPTPTTSNSVNPFVLMPEKEQEKLETLLRQESPQNAGKFFKALENYKSDYDPLYAPTQFFSTIKANQSTQNRPFQKTVFHPIEQVPPTRTEIGEILGLPDNQSLEDYIPEFYERQGLGKTLANKLLKSLKVPASSSEDDITEKEPEWA